MGVMQYFIYFIAILTNNGMAILMSLLVGVKEGFWLSSMSFFGGLCLLKHFLLVTVGEGLELGLALWIEQ